jgi:hypothetical protein
MRFEIECHPEMPMPLHVAAHMIGRLLTSTLTQLQATKFGPIKAASVVLNVNGLDIKMRLEH